MRTSTEHRGPLDGLRVVDLTTGIAGPVATMLLGDAGADVVVLEPPGGDPARRRPGTAVWRRNTRAGVLDPADAESVRHAAALVDGADVLVTVGDPPFACTNERLVRLQVPAYLPGAGWPFDLESEGLLAAATGVALRQTSTGGGPIDAVFPILPTVHGIWAAAATVAALVERERSGRGQTVTVAGVHAVMVAAAAALDIDPDAPVRRSSGGPGGTVPFYRTYRCGDGEWLFLAALTPRFTDMAFRALGLTDLYDDPRLDGRGRAAMLHPDNSPWVTQRLTDVFATADRAEWLARLHGAGCPAGPVLARDAWLDHPQLAATGLRVEVDDPERGRVVMPGVPLTLHATPAAVRTAAPVVPEGPAAPWSTAPWTLPDASDAAPTDGMGPLAGLTVLDLGAVIAGPYAGTLLAQLGAEVVKVEPLAGDSFRGPGFAAYNKGQRSLAIDLQDPRGRDAFLALVSGADVVIDNYRPGVLGRLRLRHDDLRSVNPDLVAVSVTGFGDGGPLGDEAGFDPVLQAMSGMMAAQGGDGEPVFFTVPVDDVAAASTTALGALLGVLHRRRCGQGQRVATSLAAMSALLQAGELVRFDGRPPPRVGGADHRGASALDRYHEASDGWFRIVAPEADLDATMAALGLDDDDTIAAWAATRTTDVAVRALLGLGVPAVAARTSRELVDDESMVAAGVLRPDPRPGYEGRWTTGTYALFDRTPPNPAGVAPALGEHSRAILAAAHLDGAEIDRLVEDGIVGDAPS